jgi:2-polyprenyl-3-methyl-5-hydroxy-6-metoxy-1,4-benzoquinol methylase
MICDGELVIKSVMGLLKCVKCGFITSNVELSNDEIEKLYSASYFSGEAYSDYLSDKAIIQRNFSLRLKLLEKHLSDINKKELFEIGCAYGLFLELAEKTYKCVSGIDISRDAIAYASDTVGVNVAFSDYLDYKIEKHVDLVCMWDTIEHLRHPDLVIEKVSNHLTKNGYIALTTGDIGSINARFRGYKWRQLKLPEHLHYFSRKTIEQLLNKHGFRIVHFSHCGQYMSLKTVANIMFVIKSSRSQLYEALLKSGVLNFNPYVNLFDLMCVIAQKG